MKIRKITSLTAGLAFIVMFLTSIILYITPHGRIAYWADWHLWGLTKTQWGNIHINTGLLFLFALILHIYYNWKPIMNYLKDKAKNFKLFTIEFNVALILTLVFCLGTYMEVPPLSSILTVSENIKEKATDRYGEPPYGHAELSSLKTFTKKMNIGLDKSMQLLKEAGYTVKDETQTLSTIGRANNISPKQVLDIIRPATKTLVEEQGSQTIASVKSLPDSPPVGSGNLTLADLCSQYNLNMKSVIRGLGKVDIDVKEDLTIKKIAENNQSNPIDIYEHIKTIASTQM